MMRPIPRIENGTADSMSIVAILVYVVDISEESTSWMSARMRMMRKQIIAVTVTFKDTLSENHSIDMRPGVPFS